MSLWKQMKKIWVGAVKRLGIRRTGLIKLRKDVRTCEYEDVHVLWEMLKRNETKSAKSAGGSKRGHVWKFVDWAKRAPLICH